MLCIEIMSMCPKNCSCAWPGSSWPFTQRPGGLWYFLSWSSSWSCFCLCALWCWPLKQPKVWASIRCWMTWDFASRSGPSRRLFQSVPTSPATKQWKKIFLCLQIKMEISSERIKGLKEDFFSLKHCSYICVCLTDGAARILHWFLPFSPLPQLVT